MVPKDLLQEAFEIMRPATDAPSKFLHLGALVPIAAMISGRTVFRAGQFDIRTNLFIAIIAPSSRYRKNQAISWSRNILEAVDEDLILPSEGSPEGFVDALKAHPYGVMTLGELGTFFAASQKQYSRDLGQIMCNLYDCASIKRRTKKDGEIVVRNPVVSIIGATAPSPLKEFIGTKDFLSGMIPRFLLAQVKEPDRDRMVLPPPADQERLERYKGYLKNVNEYLKTKSTEEPIEFKFSEDGRESYEESDARLISRCPGEVMEAFSERGTWMILKLACVVAYARRQSFTITSSDVVEAEGWVAESIDSARELLIEIEAIEANDMTVEDANRIKAAIEKNLNGEPFVHWSKVSKTSKLGRLRARNGLEKLADDGEVVAMVSQNKRGLMIGLRSQNSEEAQSDFDKENNINITCSNIAEFFRHNSSGRPSISRIKNVL